MTRRAHERGACGVSRLCMHMGISHISINGRRVWNDMILFEINTETIEKLVVGWNVFCGWP